MRSKRMLLFLGLSFLAVNVAVNGAAPAWAAPLADPDPFDVGPRLRAVAPAEAPVLLEGPDPAAAPADSDTAGTEYYVVGEPRIAFLLNDFTGYYQLTYYYVLAMGEHCEVWLQSSLAWPAGDPRATPQITWEQVAYVIEEFDNVIWPSDTAFFGTPDFHNGANALADEIWPQYFAPDAFVSADGQDRVIIMISNVRDHNYYIPSYPNYIAGFYSSTYELYFDRNVITIDAFDWANRLGLDAARPHLYEGIIAHEFQHLLHDDADPDEDLWFNEGCADFAGFICGYGQPWGHIEDALDLPENSLVVWEDQGPLEILADYGRAYLFVLYLFEQLGLDFVKAAYQNPGNGIAGIDATIRDGFRRDRSFAELYRDWSIALLIDAKAPAGGAHQLQTVDVHTNVGAPGAPNQEAYATPGAPPWGTDHVWLELTGDPTQALVFDGGDFHTRPTGWVSDGEVLWSGMGDMLDEWAIVPATGGGTLTFDTWYDIEDYWDFGFVQVSADGGHTWTSLANEYTTSLHDPSAIGTVVENLPGLTGFSGGWLTLSFDLSPYAGQDILVAFRYVTDWATAYEGWRIDNVRVDDALVSDGATTAPFQDISAYFPTEQDFLVTVLRAKLTDKGFNFQVKDMTLDDATETGRLPVGEWYAEGWPYALLMVTFAAPQDVTFYADYEYGYTFGE